MDSCFVLSSEPGDGVPKEGEQKGEKHKRAWEAKVKTSVAERGETDLNEGKILAKKRTGPQRGNVRGEPGGPAK